MNYGGSEIRVVHRSIDVGSVGVKQSKVVLSFFFHFVQVRNHRDPHILFRSIAPPDGSTCRLREYKSCDSAVSYDK